MKDLINSVAQSIDVVELQSGIAQVAGVPGGLPAAEAASSLVQSIITTINTGTAPGEILPTTSWVSTELSSQFTNFQSGKSTVQDEVTGFIEANYAYKTNKCQEDLSFIIDAVTYDMLYGGNSQTIDAADEYYSGGALQIPTEQKGATLAVYRRLQDVVSDCVTNIAVNPLQTASVQDVSNTPATREEATKIEQLFETIIRLIDKGYICEVTLDETIAFDAENIISGTSISFHQYSLITASGHTFEWVGAGNNVNSALPYEGGRPIPENQVIQVNGGRVYYTGTDQEGDFRIGNDLTINRTSGTIEGDTFDRSLFAVLTPYILAIED
jgi:hypothetical protein